jgi:hypothetical protein
MFRDLTTNTAEVIFSGHATFTDPGGSDSVYVIFEPPYRYKLLADRLYHVTLTPINGSTNGYTIAATTNPIIGKLEYTEDISTNGAELIEKAEDTYIVGKSFTKIKAINIVENKTTTMDSADTDDLNTRSMIFVDINPASSFAASASQEY